MDRNGRHETALTIALPGDLYLTIIMDRYGGPKTALTIALPGGLFLAIIMDRYKETQTALTICLPGGLLIIDYNGPLWRASYCPYYSLAGRPLSRHYNRQAWRPLSSHYNRQVRRLFLAFIIGSQGGLL
jgi:hypothetical protein